MESEYKILMGLSKEAYEGKVISLEGMTDKQMLQTLFKISENNRRKRESAKCADSP